MAGRIEAGSDAAAEGWVKSVQSGRQRRFKIR